MKLVTFEYDGVTQIGAVEDGRVYALPEDSRIAGDMCAFLAAGEASLREMKRLVSENQGALALDDVRLLPPVPAPSKFLAISLNYGDHIAETGRDRPEYPSFFNKQVSCVAGPGDAIHRPKVSEKLDYEGELGLVIGRRCRHVSSADAHRVIAGYTIVNDVSVRDWQIRSPTFTLGKSFDTHGPTGPWIVTADEISDPHDLEIRTWVNEDQRQAFNTGEMIFDCYEQIEYLTTVMTLEPGDIISTGTGSGVGVKMKPRGYMKPGDQVRIEIENIGTLSNPVILEPDDTALI